MRAMNQVGIGLSYRTGPPGYTAWRNWFLGIDSWAPKKFKNLGSDSNCVLPRVQTEGGNEDGYLIGLNSVIKCFESLATKPAT